MPIDPTGSVTNLNDVATSAGSWSPRFLVWVDRFKGYTPPDAGVLGGRPDPTEINGMTSEWGHDADAYQGAVDAWLNVLGAGASNMEFLADKAIEAKNRAAQEYALAQQAWAQGDGDAAELHNEAAAGFLDNADTYISISKELSSAWHKADDAVHTSQAALDASKNAAKAAVDRHNGTTGVSWKTVAIAGALGGSALVALGIYAAGRRR